MHDHGFGETNCSACQALEPCPQCQMFAFDLLRVNFAHCMGGSEEMALIDASGIGIEVLQPKRLEQLPQFDKHSICVTVKRIRQHYISSISAASTRRISPVTVFG